MAVTPSELFDQRVPRGLADQPERAAELALVIQFNVSGEGGGHWTVDTTADPPSCLPGIREDVKCTIDVSVEALQEMIEADPASRPQVFMKNLLEGGIEVEGDATQAMKLSEIFAIGTRPA